MGGRESVADVARVLSGYCDGIMARVFGHDQITELAEYASVPIINGLSDRSHPAQGLTDLFTIYESKGQLAGLTVAYVGDGNNVARSLMIGAMKTGMNFRLVAPSGYNLSGDDFTLGLESRLSDGQELTFTDDLLSGVSEADVIYTDVWTSMGQEEEAARRAAVFPPYQVNEDLVSKAKDDCIVMHCLPAHRGDEITDGVADGRHSLLFQQAENRLHAQKALLVKLMA